MVYRIDKEGLLDRLSAWDGFLGRKVRLVACGGTALTLLGLKASTKDVDLIVPDIVEYEYLIKQLNKLGYKSASGWGWARDDGFIFDIYRGNRVHTTELLESPLKAGNNFAIKEFSRLYLGILNYYDIIITKLFRGASVDMEDCFMLLKARQKDIDIDKLKKRFKETASFDISVDKAIKNLEYFLKKYREAKING